MFVFGYHPGGNGSHGAAMLEYDQRVVRKASCHTCKSVEDAISWFEGLSVLPAAIGVDTLTCWSTGASGWRPADVWLRQRYPEARASVASPNSIYGSMSLGGMSLLLALRSMFPSIIITETHPKVLYRALSGRKYDFVADGSAMLELLSRSYGVSARCGNDHEWDALISAVVAFHAASGSWHRDLHQLACARGSRLVKPCGDTSYFWPE